MKDSDIEKNFEQTDALLAILLAKTKAAELALATLIECHPHPDQALGIWDRTRLDLADEGFDVKVFPAYQPQLANSLAMWSRGFESAAGRT